MYPVKTWKQRQVVNAHFDVSLEKCALVIQLD